MLNLRTWKTFLATPSRLGMRSNSLNHFCLKEKKIPLSTKPRDTIFKKIRVGRMSNEDSY